MASFWAQKDQSIDLSIICCLPPFCFVVWDQSLAYGPLWPLFWHRRINWSFDWSLPPSLLFCCWRPIIRLLSSVSSFWHRRINQLINQLIATSFTSVLFLETDCQSPVLHDLFFGREGLINSSINHCLPHFCFVVGDQSSAFCPPGSLFWNRRINQLIINWLLPPSLLFCCWRLIVGLLSSMTSLFVRKDQLIDCWLPPSSTYFVGDQLLASCPLWPLFC